MCSLFPAIFNVENRKFKKIILLLSLCWIHLLGLAVDNLPIGARSAGMANASVCFSDVWSVHHNQAGLAFVKQFRAGASYENRFLLKELAVKAAALAIPIKSGTFGISFVNFGSSLYHENKYSISFGKPFGEKFSIGMAMDYLQFQIAEGYGSKGVVAGELGMQAKPVKNVIIAVHIFNPTRSKLIDYNQERIPTIFRLGGSYAFSEKVMLALETEKNISLTPNYKAGIEYKPVKEISIRLGLGSRPGISCYGIGIQLKKFEMDCSAQVHPKLGVQVQVALTYVLNK